MESQRLTGGATSDSESQKGAIVTKGIVAELPLPDELTALLPDGEYLVESFLGQGGMGAVYQGLQLPLRRPVAIKILQRKHTADDYHFEDRFRREAYSMATLIHPNVVQVYDCGDAGEEYLFISMELVEGGDLSCAMRHGQLALASALQMLAPICEGVQAAHEHGLVHRDIKPANIFLTTDARPKVADFGLAKRYDAKTTFMTVSGLGMGTPDYAAPEQYEELEDLDHRVDIYSLGVMFYQMLTGHLPRGTHKAASRLVQVDARVDAVLEKAMQNDRTERYQSVEQMKLDLQHILATWMAPPRPRVIMQTGRVPVGTVTGRVPVMTGRVPTVTGRVPPMTGRVPTVTGRVSTMTGRVPTVAKMTPLTTHPLAPSSEAYASRMTGPPPSAPLCAPLCASRSLSGKTGIRVLAGVVTSLFMLGGVAFVMVKHAKSSSVTAASPTTQAVVSASLPSTVAGTETLSSKAENGAASPVLSMPSRPPVLQTLDLLAASDPIRDRVSRNSQVAQQDWIREGTAMVFRGDGRPGELMTPISLECRDYEIELRAERLAGNGRIHLVLPLSKGRALPLILNDPSRHVLNEKLGPGWPRNTAWLHASIRVIRGVAGGEDYISVRDMATGLEVLIWKGRLASLGKPGAEHPEFPRKLLPSLWVHGDAYVIRTWKLTVFKGRAVDLRTQVASTASAPETLTQASSSTGDMVDPAAAVPAAAVTVRTDPRLEKLESGFQSRRESDVQKPFTTAMATLNVGYLRALAVARATAAKQGNSAYLTFFDEEMARARTGTPPPDVDAPGTPESLVRLRSTYRAEVAKYVLARDKADAGLYDIYLGALDAYIEELAKGDDTSRAREVKELRGQIAARKPVIPPPSQAQESGAVGGGRSPRGAR